MFAIASQLNPQADQQTRDLWGLLKSNCDMSGIDLTPLPHFSWMVTEEFLLPKGAEKLQKLAASSNSFRVRTAGLGIFTGPQPVLYLLLVKDQNVLSLHQRIWESILPYCGNVRKYYAPDQWVPHITIAYRDLTSDNLACAVRDLIFQPFDYEIAVESMSVIYQDGAQSGTYQTYPFGNQPA